MKEALVTEVEDYETSHLLPLDITLDPVNLLPETPVFWSAGSIVAAVLNCAPKVVTPIMCVSAYQGNRYGVTIDQVPRAVIINHDDTISTNSLFSKTANARVNRDKDYINTVNLTR